MQFKKFKSLASTHIRKITILLVISTLSSTMLCSCGDDKNSTTVEQTIDMTDEATTTDTQEATQESSEVSTEATTEQTELQNQDKDPTEATTQQTTQETTQSSNNTTQPTTTQTPTTEQAHVHTWVTETYYTTETQTVHHDAVTHVVHHDAVTHQETVTTYTTETTTVHHDGSCRCCGCGATFTNSADAGAHCDNGSDVCYGSGYVGIPGWDETVEVQVPHTETVTVVDQAAWDETVTDSPAWDETVEVQVPHTRTVCSECGAEK